MQFHVCFMLNSNSNSQCFKVSCLLWLDFKRSDFFFWKYIKHYLKIRKIQQIIMHKPTTQHHQYYHDVFLFFVATPCVMWDLGSLTRNQTAPSTWEHGVLTTAPPGKSLFLTTLYIIFPIIFLNGWEYIIVQFCNLFNPYNTMIFSQIMKDFLHTSYRWLSSHFIDFFDFPTKAMTL